MECTICEYCKGLLGSDEWWYSGPMLHNLCKAKQAIDNGQLRSKELKQLIDHIQSKL